jgi:1-aminocyclopropane-1-carboxylate synthase
MRFCAKHNIHYLSDEIYALSVFENKNYRNATRFQSVLSIDKEGIINPEMVHVLYGAAKDFCANGLRLGSFYTRSDELRKAMLSIV